MRATGQMVFVKYKNMKIILSRKGFDTGSGGKPSPFFVDRGIHFSIPIPDDNAFFSYRDLRFNDDLSLYDLMEKLGVAENERDRQAHTDPDIRIDLYSNNPAIQMHLANWEPLFGQHGHEQCRLCRQNVGPGDIFLFYGLFQDVRIIKDRYRFIEGATKRQIIWGYLQVKEVLHVNDNNIINHHHPHYHGRIHYENNTIYRAAEILSFNPNMPGYGRLPFNDRLILSKNASARANEYNLFSLPRFFKDISVVGIGDVCRARSRPDPDNNDRYLLRFPNRGQEFIFAENNEVTHWAEEIILGTENRA